MCANTRHPCPHACVCSCLPTRPLCSAHKCCLTSCGIHTPASTKAPHKDKADMCGVHTVDLHPPTCTRVSNNHASWHKCAQHHSNHPHPSRCAFLAPCPASPSPHTTKPPSQPAPPDTHDSQRVDMLQQVKAARPQPQGMFIAPAASQHAPIEGTSLQANTHAHT